MKIAPAHQAPSRQTRRRGFTLTEIAIVLGIVGLILGAIWVAAAAVYNNLRVSRANTELLQIAQTVRALYATGSTVENGAAAGTDETLVLQQAGVFPTDTVTTPGSLTGITNPWGGEIHVSSQNIANAGDSFSVAFTNVPQQPCINFLVSTTGTGRDAGLYAATGTGTATSAGTVGAGSITFASAVTGGFTATTGFKTCGAAGSANNVVFQFKLKG